MRQRASSGWFLSLAAEKETQKVTKKTLLSAASPVDIRQDTMHFFHSPELLGRL